MSNLVCMGAMMQCSFGVAPSSLVILPANQVLTGTPAAIIDNKPIVNIPPFGMCTTVSNPTVAAATTAALGVLTPMPCVPATAAPWAPGAPTDLIGNMPALDSASKLMCNWGGVMQIRNAAQTSVEIP